MIGMQIARFIPTIYRKPQAYTNPLPADTRISATNTKFAIYCK
jgi:hypothetical protein